jgi:alkylation response protein AidB-like acyl-CoA dehydrogenase
MEYSFSAKQLEIRDLARESAQNDVAPLAAQMDETGSYPAGLLKTLSAKRLLRIIVPEEWWGLGGDITSLCLASEEMGKVCGSSSFIVQNGGASILPVLLGGSPGLIKRVLEKLVAGTGVTSYLVTEPEAGSDAGSITTTARREGSNYILNGEKSLAFCAEFASVFLVLASTDPARGSRGLSMLIVEPGTPGVEIAGRERTMGVRGLALNTVILKNAVVPESNIIGRENEGLPLFLRSLQRSRPTVAAIGLGLAQGAFDYALAYARERRQFGRALVEFQAVNFMLADMAAELEAARALIYKAVRMVDENTAGDQEIQKISAMSKIFVPKVAMRVTENAVQILGGRGYTARHPVERLMRDAKSIHFAEGTTEIQKLILGRILTSQ